MVHIKHIRIEFTLSDYRLHNRREKTSSGLARHRIQPSSNNTCFRGLTTLIIMIWSPKPVYPHGVPLNLINYFTKICVVIQHLSS